MPNPFAEAMERMRALMAGLRTDAPAAPTVPPTPPASTAPRAPELSDEPPHPASEWPATVIEPRPEAPAAPEPAPTRRRAVWSPPASTTPDGLPRYEFARCDVLAVVDGWAMLLVDGDPRPCVQPAAHLTFIS